MEFLSNSKCQKIVRTVNLALEHFNVAFWDYRRDLETTVARWDENSQNMPKIPVSEPFDFLEKV